MSFREMFLAEHPIDGEQMLEEARIKAARGSALFDALETHMKKALLSTIRERVHVFHNGQMIIRSVNPCNQNACTCLKFLSLLTEIEGEMK